MNILTFLDLHRNEIRNFVYQNLAADPSSPVNGMRYYNTATNKFRRYENGGWVDDGNNLTAGDIKSFYESNSDTNAFTDALLAKLNAVQAGATDDQTGAEIESLYEALANTNKFSDADKTKLDGLEGSKFLGTFASEAALETAFPAAAATAGQYADVDAGAGADVKRYVLDDDDDAWKPSTGSISGETSTSIKTKYEANADTNAFTDALLAALQSLGAKFSSTISGDGSATSFPVVHSKNTLDVQVQVVEVSTGETVITDVVRSSVNNVNIVFGIAPANGKEYRVTVI